MSLKTYLQSHSQVELARKLGVTSGAVSQWANGTTKVAAERCPAIEQATGGLVRCEDLRPDVQWSVLRNTPAFAAAVPVASEPAAPAVISTAPVGALRAGATRRHVSRRAQEAAADRDRRAKSGPPFQSVERGVA